MTTDEHGCLIVADDLTGACDAAAAFAARGFSTVAWLKPGPIACDAHVIALSTGSRDATAEEAVRAMHAAASRAPRQRTIFKKIDSMLRGCPGVEIAVALEAFGCDFAVVTPAFPAMGRTVEAGCLRNAWWDSPTVDVAALLSAQGLGRERLTVVDAGCDADLDAAVERYRQSEKRVLWAGSAGLAAALARRMGAGPRVPDRGSRQGPVLFVLGSDHAVTMEQQQRLVAGCPAVLLPAQHATPECLRASIARDQHMILRVARHLPPSQLRACVEAVKDRISAILLSGGDTAAMVCAAFEVESIQLIDEIATGIARGRIGGGVCDGLTVVTKSGAFGGPDTLLQIANTLRGTGR